MAYLKHVIEASRPEWCILSMICSRYTILVGNPRYIVEIYHSGLELLIKKRNACLCAVIGCVSDDDLYIAAAEAEAAEAQ